MHDTAAAKGKKIEKLVLDAGHGGSDGGAHGQFSNEKDLTLAIVLKVGKMMQDSLKDVKVLYTRTTDVYPSLAQRHEIANTAAADLFVSVHINSTAGTTERISAGTRTVKRGRKRVTVPVYKTIRHRETGAAGVMTLVLGNIRNNQKKAAMGEYGDELIDNPGGEEGILNANNPQTAILIEQYTNAFLGRSVALADKIQSRLVVIPRNDLGVRQQSLEVLAGSYMPGVLVECGFINNPDEEAYLNSETGQMEIARAIFNGIREYKIESERH